MSELSWKTKVYIGAAIVAIISCLLLIIKWQHDLIKKQEAIQTSFIEQKQLADGITRAQSGYLTKDDLNKFAKDFDIKLDPIKKDLNEFGAKVQGISRVKIVTEGSRVASRPSDITTPRILPASPKESDIKKDDTYGYIKNRQAIKLNEPFSEKQSIPLGQVGFSAWQEKPWDVEIYKRQYLLTNVLGIDENGKHYVYNKFTIVTGDKKYNIKITDSKFVEELPDSKFRFSPHLYLGIDGGAYVTNVGFEVSPNLQIALFSYGLTKSLPDWTFLGLGLDYATQHKNLGLILSPINYNIAKHVPLIDNTYIGPSISLDTDKNISLLWGLRVGL
jgi:hypothetical protein